MALAGSLYQAWTNPAGHAPPGARQAQRKLRRRAVSVESARLRLLGGIAVSDLRMARRDDLDTQRLPLRPLRRHLPRQGTAPRGRLAIRKVELNRPRLRLVRERDGRWNLNDVCRRRPRSPSACRPLVVHQGTVVLEDRTRRRQAPCSKSRTST